MDHKGCSCIGAIFPPVVSSGVEHNGNCTFFIVHMCKIDVFDAYNPTENSLNQPKTVCLPA